MGIGAVGIVIGVATGLGINWLLEKTHWIDLPADIYNLGSFPVIVRWHEVALIALSTILIVFLATLYPSYKVAHSSPLSGLRYE